MEISATVLRDVEAAPAAETVNLGAPRPDEVRVRLASSGICATDVHAAGLVHAGMLQLPVVLGHEGAGVVEAVGDRVGRVAVGDHVAMVFDSCGTCHHCVRNAPSYCSTFDARNFGGGRLDGSTSLSSEDGEAIGSHFLGQSAFATHAVVSERSVVKIDADIPLEVVGPFGCGIMTGAGAVLNELAPPVGSTIAVFGAGTVGLAGVMAAKLAGCAEIVAVDLSPERLEVARRVGATQVVDAASDDVAAAVRELVPGGVGFSLDTTGLTKVVSAAVAALAPRGRCGVVGVGADQTMELDWRTMLAGRSVMGITSGSAAPDVFLPELLALHRAGRFPVDELVTYYPFADFGQALADSRSGAVVKAVLTY
jgi:aryl-alcohol dehydrogenase